MNLQERLLLGVAFASVAWIGPARVTYAETAGQVALTTRWVDEETWGRGFSDDPGVEWNVSQSLGNAFYLEAAGRVGFDGFDGPSSEIDVGAGVTLSAGGPATISLYGGRWQYGSEEGFKTGDWVAQLDFELPILTLSAIVLRGDDEDDSPDTEIYRAAIEVSPWRGASLIASVAYITAESEWNPALALKYDFTDHAFGEIAVVRDRDEEDKPEGVLFVARAGWQF